MELADQLVVQENMLATHPKDIPGLYEDWVRMSLLSQIADNQEIAATFKQGKSTGQLLFRYNNIFRVDSTIHIRDIRFDVGVVEGEGWRPLMPGTEEAPLGEDGHGWTWRGRQTLSNGEAFRTDSMFISSADFARPGSYTWRMTFPIIWGGRTFTVFKFGPFVMKP